MTPLTELFIWALGLCVGSFLNVVIYRLPAGLSVAAPRWSFCPACRAVIRWYDNIPILSWLALRGRCRACRLPIAPQYPLVEALTGLVFLLVYHLLFIDQTRHGITALLPRDLPLLLAWLTLAAAMVACSAMDIATYTVDVRLTELAAAAGVLLSALWPRGPILAEQAASPAAAGGAAAFVVSLVMLWWSVWRAGAPCGAAPVDDSSHDDDLASRRAVAPVAGAAPPRWPIVLGMVALVLCSAGIIGHSAALVPTLDRWFLPAAAITMLFLVTALAGSRQRAVDVEVADAIQREQPVARYVILGELLWLTPMILAGAGVTYLAMHAPAFANGWRHAMSWSPGGGLHPLAGASLAMHGAMIGAAAGWLLRIVFTLILGREAFGLGDVYILAAIGAAAGWDIAVIGLLLSTGIAMLGLIVGLATKSTAVIPFGPWLSLGFLAALWLDRPLHRLFADYADNLHYAWSHRPDIVSIVGGLLLVGGVGAMMLARVVRGALERGAPPPEQNLTPAPPDPAGAAPGTEPALPSPQDEPTVSA